MTFVDSYFLLNRLNLGVPSEICTCTEMKPDIKCLVKWCTEENSISAS